MMLMETWSRQSKYNAACKIHFCLHVYVMACQAVYIISVYLFKYAYIMHNIYNSARILMIVDERVIVFFLL